MVVRISEPLNHTALSSINFAFWFCPRVATCSRLHFTFCHLSLDKIYEFAVTPPHALHRRITYSRSVNIFSLIHLLPACSNSRDPRMSRLNCSIRIANKINRKINSNYPWQRREWLGALFIRNSAWKLVWICFFFFWRLIPTWNWHFHFRTEIGNDQSKSFPNIFQVFSKSKRTFQRFSNRQEHTFKSNRYDLSWCCVLHVRFVCVATPPSCESIFCFVVSVRFVYICRTNLNEIKKKKQTKIHVLSDGTQQNDVADRINCV